jgi:hypothetical protein
VTITIKADTAELVLRLACLTDDRTKAEVKALADLAFRIDQDRNATTVTNPRVGAVAEPSDLVGELDLPLDAKREATRQRRLAAWPGLVQVARSF